MSAFSPIQNHILSKLKNADRLRYRDLKPGKIPNDLFNYHLQFLVKKGYVDRSEKGYALGELGIKHVAEPDILRANEGLTNLFKLNVITIVSRKVKGKIEILSQVRKSHPSYGKIGVMGGVVRKEESVEAVASRKLRVETGLVANFKLIGIERRIMYAQNELFSDMIFPIAYVDKYEGGLTADTEFGHNFWTPIEKAIKNELSEYDSLIKVVDVLKAIKAGKINKLPFFYEEDIQTKP